MKKITERVAKVCLALGVLISLWLLINNLYSIKALLVALSMVALWAFQKKYLPKLPHVLAQKISNITQHRHFSLIFILAITVTAIAIRLLFFFAYSYSPISDPGSFFTRAQAVASGAGLVGDVYVSFFPYLAAYAYVLGLAVKLIGNAWLATIILNTILDIAAAAIASLLIKKISDKKSKKYLIIYGLWLLSPFNIIFSVLSLPVIAVNFFIVLAIFLTYMLSRKVMSQDIKSSLILALILGLTLGYANCFRPLFPIVIIAILLYFAYILLTNKFSQKVFLLSLSSILIIIAIFFGVQRLNVAFVSGQTGLNVPSDASGWSIYVGSNASNTGGWNAADNAYLYGILNKNTDMQRLHDQLAREGIERYKSLGVSGTISLMFRKLSLFAGNQNWLYDAEASIVGYQGSIISKFISVYILAFVFIIFTIAGIYLYRIAVSVKFKRETDPIVIFIVILMLGFFFSSMFVEAQIRYAQVMYPMFVVVGAVGVMWFSNRRLK